MGKHIYLVPTAIEKRNVNRLLHRLINACQHITNNSDHLKLWKRMLGIFGDRSRIRTERQPLPDRVHVREIFPDGGFADDRGIEMWMSVVVTLSIAFSE